MMIDQLALLWAVRADDFVLRASLAGAAFLALLPPLAFSHRRCPFGSRRLGAATQRVQQIDHIRSGLGLAGGNQPPLEFGANEVGQGLLISVVEGLRIEAAALGCDDMLGEVEHFSV